MPDRPHALASEPAPATARSLAILTLLTAAGLAVLVALGLWQVRRLEWKTDLIARFEAALAHPPRPYAPPANSAAETGREFTRVSVTGRYIDSDTVKLLEPTPQALRAQTQDGFGYQLFTALDFGGGVVFVDRGFVPQSLAGKIAPAGQETVTITGLLRLSQPPGLFTLAPNLEKREFFSADIPEMAADAGLKPGNAVTAEYIQSETPPAAGNPWPKPRDPRELLAAIPNRHFEYALTWFGLAAALLGVYGAYLFRFLRGNKDASPANGGVYEKP